jgi:hypothetical protein
MLLPRRFIVFQYLQISTPPDESNLNVNAGTASGIEAAGLHNHVVVIRRNASFQKKVQEETCPATRRQFSAGDKIRTVLEDLRGKGRVWELGTLRATFTGADSSSLCP